jgi:hypothetical protein
MRPQEADRLDNLGKQGEAPCRLQIIVARSARTIQLEINMKAFLPLIISLVTVFATMSANAQKPDQAKLDQLNRFAGTWEKKFTIYKSEWTPEEQTKSGTHTCSWVLENSHLQETGTDSDGGTYITMYSYDAATMAYRASAFQSTGNSWQMKGTWSDDSNTFTWSHEVMPGVQMIASHQFITPDQFKFSYLVKDKANKILFRLEGTGKRVTKTK